MIIGNYAAGIEVVSYDSEPPVTIVKGFELQRVNDAGEYETLRISRKSRTESFGMRSDYARNSESNITY